MITATKLTYAYGAQRVVDRVSLTTPQGQVLGLIGPNGSGKTTLLRMLYGALQPDTGTVYIDDAPLQQLNARTTAQQLAVVVQESEADTTLTVGEMVLLGRAPYNKLFARATPQDHQLAANALQRVGVGHLGHRPFTSLSGGERQRVLIARALAQQGRHLLLDEPTNHLDIRYQHEILTLVRSLGVTTVVVLHDLNLAAQYCDKLILLDQGCVVATGLPDHVLEPDIIHRVYGIHTDRQRIGDRLHLSFTLHPDHPLVASQKGP